MKNLIPLRSVRPPHSLFRTTMPKAAMLLLAGLSLAPGTAQAAVPVDIRTAQAADIAFPVTTAAKTEAFRTAEVRPQISGIVRERRFTEGVDVKAGDILYLLDDRAAAASLSAAEAALAKAEAALVPLRLKRDRCRAMLATKAISQQDFDDADAAFRVAAAEVESCRAKARESRVAWEYTRITAPISGRIGLSSVTEGALVTAHQAAPLAIIRQSDPIRARFSISASELSEVRRGVDSGMYDSGGPGTVRLLFDDGTEYKEDGSIDFTDAAVDEGTGVVALRAVFPNSGGVLMPGMNLRVRLVTATSHGILLPKTAVLFDAKGRASVFVAHDGVARRRIVMTGRSVGGERHIVSGIMEGEPIVVGGLRNVRDGIEIEPSSTGAGGKRTPDKPGLKTGESR